VLAAARLVARFFGEGWIVEHELAPLERRAANISHFVLYGAIVGIPTLGWLTVSARGRPVSVFGLFDLPALIAKDRDLADTLQQWHYFAALAMLAMVGLHVAAALYHHFIRKDAVLKAMF
jgi:cytochrome b561